MSDYYERRDELRSGQVFRTECGDIVRLDRRLIGDGTDWIADVWMGSHFSCEDMRLHPSELIERLPDNFAG